MRFWLESQGQERPEVTLVTLVVECVLSGKAEGCSSWRDQCLESLTSIPTMSLGKHSWASMVRRWVQGD